jgi:hypothetical protein
LVYAYGAKAAQDATRSEEERAGIVTRLAPDHGAGAIMKKSPKTAAGRNPAAIA